MKTKQPKKPDSPLFTRGLYAIGQDCLAKDSLSPAIDLFRDRANYLRSTTGGGKGWSATAARLENGKLPAIFAKGNGKLPFFAFSSLAGVDCPQAGSCLYGANGDLMGGFCYSFRAWRYPPAFARQLVNSLRLRSKAGRDAILQAWMELPKGAIVRLYVDGDFASLDILGFWFRLCFARPDLQVYGYSKSWRILLDYAAAGGRFPANYLLNLSSGGSGTSEEREAVSRLPIARGEFIAIQTQKDHGKAYQSRRNAGFSDYARDVKESAGRRVFVCSGKCGDCTPSGHACGSEKFRGVDIAIGIH
jgi:hypothetical protein